MERALRDKKAICLFVLPALIIYTALVILPIFFSGYYSTLNWDGFGEKVFTGLENYRILLVDNQDGFIQAILNSFILAGLSVFVQIPLALLLALIISKGIKGENFYRTVFFIPVIISTVVIGQMWMKVYHPEYGFLNVVLRNIGLGSLANQWLGSTDTALTSVFIPLVWQYIGNHMLLLYAAIKSIPKDIFEAAYIDGASYFQTSISVTIPLIKPMIKTCVTLAIIGSLKTFDLIYVLTGGGPDHATEVPSTIMFNTIFAQFKYGYGSAMAVFIAVECLVFTVVLQKIYKVEEITY